ncbi:MAG: TolC family protein [Planctomycetaceae bacterium]|nr:TolC family protein [Planctomycetaceae bacterium]
MRRFIRKIRRLDTTNIIVRGGVLACLPGMLACRHAGLVVDAGSESKAQAAATVDSPSLVPSRPGAPQPLYARTREATPLPQRVVQVAGSAANSSLNASAIAPSDDNAEGRSVEEITDPAFSTEPAPSAAMSLDELVAIAIANNPSIAQANATARKAMGVRWQLGLYPNPVVGYSGEEIGDSGTAGMQGAYLSQTIVLGDKLSWNRAVAEQEVQSLLWQAEAQRFRVRNDVQRQFYATLGAQERMHLADELHQIALDGLENAEALRAAQQAALPDVLQARVQLQEVQIIRQNASYDYTAKWEQLAALIGWPQLASVELQPILFDEQPLRDATTAWEQIALLSPQLQQARAEVQQARQRIGRERVQPIPNLQVNVGMMYINQTDDGAANIMLGVPVPLFNANEGNIARASADYQRACHNVRRIELSLQSQLADRFRQYQQAHNRVVTYRDEILPAQSETLELITQAYPLQFDFLRLLTARRMYYEARLTALEAVIDLRQAEVELDGMLLTGGLSDVPDTSLDDTLRDRALNGQ